MTDLLAVASCVVTNEKVNGVTIDSVFKKPQKDWNYENIITGYFPNANYQNIVKNGNSIFAECNTDTGKMVKINDFIYGSMCDPLYIAKVYDETLRNEGLYFKVCEPIDEMVERYAYHRMAP